MSDVLDVLWNGLKDSFLMAWEVWWAPRPPFRFVGYTGDPGHGRGNHLHLSWQHGPRTADGLAS